MEEIGWADEVGGLERVEDEKGVNCVRVHNCVKQECNIKSRLKVGK